MKECADLWSISSTFYESIFCRTKVLHTAFFYLHVNVTREKLPKRFSFEKGARKMLMKLTPICVQNETEDAKKITDTS